MFHPHRILHPTDYSPQSAFALSIAADLARQHGAHLFILHVAETLGPANVTYGEIGSQLEPDGYQERLRTDLRHHAPAPAGVKVEYVLREGSAATEIAKCAAEHECDLVVLGTHGRAGMVERLFMGSVAEAVVRLAPCPVLVAKSTKAPHHT